MIELKCDYCQEKFEHKELEKCDTCGEWYCSDCLLEHKEDKEHFCKGDN